MAEHPLTERRFAQIIKVKHEFVQQYKEAHASVWPEVLKQIEECNIRNCKSSLYDVRIRITCR